MANYWMKLDFSMLGDRALKRAARKGATQLQLLPWLLLFAKQANDGARLTVDGEPAEPEDIADVVPCTDADSVARAIRELLDLNILIEDHDGAARFVMWCDQAEVPPSDTREARNERKRKQRERLKALHAGAVNHDDAGSSDDNRNAEVHADDDVTGDVTGTVTDDVTSSHAVTSRDSHTESQSLSRDVTSTEVDTEIEKKRDKAAAARGYASARVEVLDSISGNHHADATHEARVALAVAVNKGLAMAQNISELPNPLRATDQYAYDFVHALQQHGVTLDFACRIVFERASQQGRKRVRSLTYFLDAVLEAWSAEQVRDQANAAPPPGTRAHTTPGVSNVLMVHQARKGNPEAIEYCAAQGIVFTEATG